MARFFGLFDNDRKDEEVVEDVEFAEDVEVEPADVEFAEDTEFATDVDAVAVNDVDVEKDGKLLLRKEELDISKNVVRTGEVRVHKDIIEEHKSVQVPVSHEQVVIERHSFVEPSDVPVGTEEVIRIPVSEERVEVGKHTVVTGSVEVFKREVEETREVNETLRREEARVDVEGHPDLINESSSNLH